ncbi:MAG: hypothetical protein MUC88_26580 [Planctomycetes bacterium]|jgi:hypothetical protein|nr:hypothetical protein [Planctomycetota bacterium]
MKPNPSLDELLCSFMDGELSPRQRTEVQRMAAHDPQVARRLRQLQNGHTLLHALPVTPAPRDLLDQIKTSLERHTLLQPPVAAGRRAGVWHLAFRRFVSAAALIALVGVLGVVVYRIVAPVPPTGSAVVADAGLTGRLELRTARLGLAETYVALQIKESGLTSQIEPDGLSNSRVYRVGGTRDDVNRLIASLSKVWQHLEGATLEVEGRAGSTMPVVVEGVLPEQIVGIVAQGSAKASAQMAANYAVTNRVAMGMPGGEVRSLIQNDLSSVTLPRPAETKSGSYTPAPLGRAEVNLTIVVKGVR